VPVLLGMTVIPAGEGRFVGRFIGHRSSPAAIMFHSEDDGITWADLGPPDMDTGLLLFGNGVFVSARSDIEADGGSTTTIATSSDALHWTVVRSVPKAAVGAAFGHGIFAVSFDSDEMLTSTDGTAWDSHPSSFGSVRSGSPITFVDDTFLAWDTAGRFSTSPDATTWTDLAAPAFIPGLGPYEFTLFAGGFVGTAATPAGGEFSDIETVASTDGGAWIALPDDVLRAYTAFGGELYAASFGGGIKRTADGVSWSSTSVKDRYWQFTRSSTTLVAAETCHIMTTTDGETWTERLSR
jgi:hypothetical protein